MNKLIQPHGDKLINLVVGETRAEELKQASHQYPAHTLTQRQACDLELLLNGAFSPLTGFMTEPVYEGVRDNLQLPDGTLWPIPITLDVPDALAEELEVGGQLALQDSEGFMLAVLNIESIWQPDVQQEIHEVYGTNSTDHPGVRYLSEQTQATYVGGNVEGVQLPFHHDFEDLWNTPQELRHLFEKSGWQKVVAFHTSKPMHRIHREITVQAAKQLGANILLHPAVGMTKPGDLHYFARVHCYEAIRKYYPHHLAMLSLLPIAMRMAGPREALLNMIVRQNYGCSHFIVGPEHAAPPNVREDGKRFYPSYAAQEFIVKHQSKLEIQMAPVQEMRYVPEQDRFVEVKELEKSKKTGLLYTDKHLHKDLLHNEEIPDWFTYPEVIESLRKVCKPRNQQGITLFFTGLSGSGKSTLAKILYAKFIEDGGRPVTLLDGDIVRQHLSSELGFTKAHRNINVRRIGFVASQITKNAGIAICAPIAPYTAMRRAVREMIEEHGAYIEIHVSTPLEECEARDRKGLYAKARKGIIPEFTGISDPYEEPEKPELRIDTTNQLPMQAAQQIMLYLFQEGYLDGA